MPSLVYQKLGVVWNTILSALIEAFHELRQGLGVLWQHGDWHLESAWPIRHGPSQIPTDLDLPHKAFGSQVVHDSPFERPDILPFSIYAACRILDTTPDDATNGDIYEALRTIAACYVRADMSGICDCITAYKLTDVLSKATRLKRMQQALVEGCQGQNRPDEQGAKQESGKRKSLEAKEQPGNRKSLEDKVGDDPAYHCAVKGQPLADPNKESHTLQGTIGALMHELEAILHEYLSFNWDRMEEMSTTNAPLQRKEGLACPWRPSRDIQHSALGSFRERDFMHDDGEQSDGRDSDTSSQSPGTRSSRMRRMTFPIDDEDIPSAGESSQESTPRSHSESPKRPPLPPASPQQSPLRPFSRQHGVSFQGQHQQADAPPLSLSGDLDRHQQADHSGDLDRHQQAGHSGDQPFHSQQLNGLKEDEGQQQQPSSPRRVPERRKSVDDGFNSDPEHCSRALRLKATQNAHSENPRSPPGVPRTKGNIRRAASEAQLMSRYAGRAGTAQAFGSFGSHTSDSTRSFDEYLRNHRSPSPSPKSRAHERAKRNWQRAQKAAEKSITMNLLKGKRELVTLAELAKMLGGRGDQSKLDPDRQPICLLLGGGMAAGKSTVRKIIGQAEFWTRVGKDAVVVEADAMKSMDVLYKQLSKMSSFQHEPDLSSYVHEYSTKQAEALFVSAINRQKDVIFDGTMMWAPFVEQTIAMVRDHQHNYRRGPGYQKDEAGKVTEQYWEIDPESTGEACQHHKPYRIEVIGVTCDPGLAVARGVWRKLRTGRSVRSATLLRSHRLFSEHYERTAHLVDVATLYHTGSALTTFNKGSDNLQPKVIALRSLQYTSGEMLYNPDAYAEFKAKIKINDEAACRADLYSDKVSPENSSVPVSQEGQMSALRHALRTADEDEREQRYQALLSAESQDDIDMDD